MPIIVLLNPCAGICNHEVQADELHSSSGLQEDLTTNRIILYICLCGGRCVDLHLKSIQTLLLLDPR
jgi:hypothetical protein